jgi:site-specific DNA-cytosine methylase
MDKIMNDGINVLSLFDGISCGQIALQRANVKVSQYFASEIDKHAIKVTQKNYPNTIQLGSAVDLTAENLPEIHLIIGGSPCQSLAACGDGSGFDGKSKLFYEYVRILNDLKAKNPNIYFLLENVVMKKKWENVITNLLEVKPIKINSALVSGQSRNRLYWTNIPNVIQPKDKEIYLKDALEEHVEEKYFYSEKAISYLDRNKINKRFAMYSDSEKSTCLTANFCKSLPYNVYVDKEKSFCLTANYSNMACVNYNKSQGQIVFHNDSIRRLTPTECEKLQTLPFNYTEGISNCQRYKAIGNGWTVDVIAHIFSFLPDECINNG